MSENKFDKQLEKLLKGAKGRILTVAIIAEKDDWQLCSEVYLQFTKRYKQWTNYVYEISGQYSTIVELSADREKVRMRKDHLSEVKKGLKPFKIKDINVY